MRLEEPSASSEPTPEQQVKIANEHAIMQAFEDYLAADHPQYNKPNWTAEDMQSLREEFTASALAALNDFGSRANGLRDLENTLGNAQEYLSNRWGLHFTEHYLKATKNIMERRQKNKTTM